MSMILFLMVVIGAVLLFDARSRLKRLEQRQRELEAILPRPSAIAQADLAPPPVAAPRPPIAAPEITDPLPAPILQPELAMAEPKPAPPPSTPPASAIERTKARGFSFDFEELFGRRLPIWAGGITLAIAGVLIVKYAIDIGLFGRVFTPPVQIVCGLLFGFGLIGGAEFAHRQRARVNDPRVSQALSGAGISTLYAAILVAVNAYALISPLTAFLGLALVTLGALGLSLRHGMPSALLGLVGGLAAPALTMGAEASVPLLSTYLALTIAALVGVSRTQRWLWLAPLALIGGAGWSLWLIVAGHALGVVSALSLGGLVLGLAIAAPLFAFEGPRTALMQTAAAVVGAAQLALLVALGGFAPLHWALFGCIMAAGQWLAWRDAKLAIVPTIGLGLSVLLLLIWPAPQPDILALVSLVLAAIHAVPLLMRVWSNPARVQRAVEMCGLAAAAPVIALRHFWADDAIIAGAAGGGALLVLAAAAMGWNVTERRDDKRFAWLIATAAALLMTAAWFTVSHWQAPLFSAAIVAAMVILANRAGDRRIELVASAFAVFAVLQLAGTVRDFTELSALVEGRGEAIDALSILRWAGLAAMAALLAWRAERAAIRDGSGFAAAALAYGALAQAVPLTVLPLIAPLCVAALAAAAIAMPWERLRASALALVAITGGWALLPIAVWTTKASLSLYGEPMVMDAAALTLSEIARRLLGPVLLLGLSLWLLRDRLDKRTALSATLPLALVGTIALHCLYRLGFSALFGADFVQAGLPQRLIWSAALIGAGYALWKHAGEDFRAYAAPALVGLGTLHALWYSIVLHNPLWSAQAVGPVPLANLLAPLFAAVPLGIWLLGWMARAIRKHTDKALQPAIMVMLALFAWASLRQAFHGSLLTAPGLGSAEDIARSILGIALAVGYLLWGIRSNRRDWRIVSLVLMLAAVGKVFLFDASGLEGLLRIASFVALGFSLIGIGWLYSRQLRSETAIGAPAGAGG